MPLPTPPPDAASAGEVTIWRDVAERDDYDAEWHAMAPHVVAPPGYTVYRALPAASFDALLSRLARAESALREIREYVVKAESACLDGERARTKDMRDHENMGIYQTLCEQRYAWEQKAASYRALLAFIDVSSSSPAAPGTGG